MSRPIKTNLDFELTSRALNLNDPLVAQEAATKAYVDRHPVLRELIHLAAAGGPMEGWASGAFRETLPLGDPFPTSIIWYEDATKTKKIVAKLLVLAPNKLPTSIIWSVYASDGTTVIATVTDAITYTTVFEVSRTRTVT
jgi:hypothetical protein